MKDTGMMETKDRKLTQVQVQSFVNASSYQKNDIFS